MNPAQTSYQAATIPSFDGYLGNAGYLCTAVASSGYSSGQFIPASEAIAYTLCMY